MKQTEQKLPAHAWLSILCVFIVSVLVFVYYEVTPYYADDLNFGVRWKDYIMGEISSFDWGEYANWLKWELSDDSFRAFNILLPLFIYLPKTIFNLLTAIIFGLIAVFTCRVAGIPIKEALRVNLSMAGLLLMLPWEDGMTSIAFTLNYVWELLPALLSLWLLTRAYRHGITILIVTGFVAGWGQELAGCALIAGYAVWCLINYKTFNRRTLYVFIPLALATMFLVINACFGRYTKHLIYDMTLFDWYYPLQMLVIFVTNFSLVAIALFLTFILTLRRSSRKTLVSMRSGAMPIIFTAMIVSTVEGWLLTEIGTRSCWFAQFFALLVILSLIKSFAPQPLIKSSIVSNVLSAIVLGLVSANLIIGTLATRSIAAETEFIIKNYLIPDTDGCRFSPMESFKDLPPLAYNRLPLAATRELSILWVNYRNFFGKGNEPYPIPSRLRDINLSELIKIPGQNPFYFYHGWIVRKASHKGHSQQQYVITYNWGVRRNANFEYAPFIDDNGIAWDFAMITSNDAQSRWAKIKSIDTK